MIRYFLGELAIEGFRGINNDGDPLVLRFRVDAVNSIHAPNGVGKSSIFEAIHFAIYGTVPRLKALQDAEQGDSYVVNKFHPGQQTTIDLIFKSDDGTPDITIKVTQTANGARVVTSPSGHPHPEQFLATLQEDFVLVDYGRFAKLIDNSALERGRSFASLVGLSRYSRLRQGLDGARRTQNINSDLGLSALDAEVKANECALGAIERRIIAARDEVAGAGGAAINKLADLKTAVTSALSSIALLKPLVGSGAVMDLDFDAAEKAIEKEEGGEARRKLDALTTAVASLSATTVADPDIADVERLVGLAKRRDEAIRSVGAHALHTLLRDALAVVTAADWHDPNQCPVCEAKGDGPLKPKLEAKIAQYDAAVELGAELVNEIATATGIEKLRQLEEAAAMTIGTGDRLHIAFDLAAKKGEVTTADLEKIRERLVGLEKHRKEALGRAQQEASTLHGQLPPSLVQVTRTLSFAKQFRDAVVEFETAAPRLRAKQDKLKLLNRWKIFITGAAQSFADAEAALANERIAEIQISCQGLFGRFVRGGPDVKPTLSRAQNSENVDLKLAEFFGLQDLSARALLSESYRNAVAAAIFLAAALKHSGVPRFMVLDDVTSSFDAGHQFALMDALRTLLQYGAMPDGLQFIILSHDTSLEKYFDKLNGTTDWHHQKLHGMPPKGRLMVSAQEADRLKAQAQQHLNAGQVDIGAPFLRQYLEYKLGQIISKLEVPVPPDYATRGDRRTLSTYIDAITDAVTLYQAAGCCVMSAQQIRDLQNHHAPSIVGNFISHYETGAGTPFNAYALLGVLQSINGLADCFTYVDPANGQKKYYRRLDRR
ncbi:AAA family ATPase [Nitrospira defluvii]|uniref:AAA_23 domain-containing protein n=1 Tax=Nitrospira defluvii TaxID=330214 RepID=A0ABN7LUI3_9BACT|nr:AAA family ATPase [Nitrospira defluvii]CAE6770043.1 AAA_23 domain-containing protein [Nitrospira defluvii]